MRLLYVINDLSYFRAHRERLALDAANAGHEVIIASGDVTAQNRKNWNPALQLIELQLDKHKFRPFSDLKLVILLFQIIARTKPDVVHCFTIKPILFGGLAVALAKLIGRSTKLVWTFAGLGKIFEPGGQDENKPRRWIITSVLRLLSSFTSATASFENPADQAMIVTKGIISDNHAHTIMGTGIDLDMFSNVDRPLKAKNEPIKFLMATRLIKSKGVQTYIDAAEQFHRDKANARFSLAGIMDAANPDAVEMSAIENAQSRGSIHFLGEVSQAEMPAHLRDTDVFCLPTQLREGLPRSLLEAAACGCALIASDQPAMDNIVIDGKTGWLINSADPASLKTAVGHALRNRKRTVQMGHNSRQNLEGLPVTPQAVWRQFESIYLGKDKPR